MPVIAIGAAVVLDAGVISTAIAGGIGAISTLSAITAIGATMGAIGAITHDKTLSMIGMGIGIVGAVGTLAGADLGNLGDIFGSSTTAGAGDAAEAGAVTASSTTVDTGATGLDAAGVAPDGADDLVNSTAAADALPSTTAAEGLPTIASTEGLPSTAATGVSASTAATGGNLEFPDVTKAFLQPTTTAGLPTGIASGVGITGVPTSEVSGLMAWANKNPMMTFGALQAGGSLISGLTNPMTPAQIDALNSQAEVNRATAALIQRQTANQGQGLPTVTGSVAPAGGTINNTAVKAPLITGAPATAPLLSSPVTGAPA